MLFAGYFPINKKHRRVKQFTYACSDKVYFQIQECSDCQKQYGLRVSVPTSHAGRRDAFHEAVWERAVPNFGVRLCIAFTERLWRGGA